MQSTNTQPLLRLKTRKYHPHRLKLKTADKVQVSTISSQRNRINIHFYTDKIVLICTHRTKIYGRLKHSKTKLEEPYFYINHPLARIFFTMEEVSEIIDNHIPIIFLK